MAADNFIDVLVALDDHLSLLNLIRRHTRVLRHVTNLLQRNEPNVHMIGLESNSSP